MSSLASTLCLARQNQMRPMMTHITAELLSIYFTNIADTVQILESQFCSPWKDLSFVNFDKMIGNKGWLHFFAMMLVSDLLTTPSNICSL